MTTHGKCAYDAYTTELGSPSRWDDLNQLEQAAWEAAAAKVIGCVVDELPERPSHIHRAAVSLQYAVDLVRLVDVPAPEIIGAAAAALRAAEHDLIAAAPQVSGVSDTGQTVTLACDKLGVPDAVA